jgi:hypothetical protein
MPYLDQYNNNGAGSNDRRAGSGCELFSLAFEAAIWCLDGMLRNQVLPESMTVTRLGSWMWVVGWHVERMGFIAGYKLARASLWPHEANWSYSSMEGVNRCRRRRSEVYRVISGARQIYHMIPGFSKSAKFTSRVVESPLRLIELYVPHLVLCVFSDLGRRALDFEFIKTGLREACGGSHCSYCIEYEALTTMLGKWTSQLSIKIGTVLFDLTIPSSTPDQLVVLHDGCRHLRLDCLSG